MRALLLPCLILFTAAPAHADLQDVRARISGQEGRVWLAFDTQPTTVEVARGETGADLLIGGVSVAVHRLSPASRELVTALDIQPLASGARLHLEAAQAWQSVSAELRTGGVLLTVTLGTGLAPDAEPRPASTYPPVDPHWAPTPVPGAQSAAPEAAHTDAPPAPAGPAMTATDPDPAHAGTAADPSQASAAQAHADMPDAAHAEAPAPAGTSAARASALPAQAASMAAASLPPGTARCQAAAADFEANPWDDATLMIHAGCLSTAGDIATAAILYQQMLAFEPDNVEAALGLADIRVQQGDPVAARELYNLAASHATTDAQAARARTQAQALQHH